MNIPKFFPLLLFLASPAFVVAAEPKPTLKDWIDDLTKIDGVAVAHKEKPRLQISKLRDEKKYTLKGLKPPPGITELVLHGFAVTDEDLETVATWKELIEIQLIDCIIVTDKGVKALATLPKLQELVLADTAVTGVGVNAFSGHKTLEHFTVTNTVVENKVLSVDLKDLPKLRLLILNFEGMKELRLTKLPKLRDLTDFSGELEQATIADVGELNELNFRGTKLKKLELKGLPKLEELDLRKTRMTAEDIAKIEKDFPKVKVIK